jgi:pantoate kinase
MSSTRISRTPEERAQEKQLVEQFFGSPAFLPFQEKASTLAETLGYIAQRKRDCEKVTKEVARQLLKVVRLVEKYRTGRDPSGRGQLKQPIREALGTWIIKYRLTVQNAGVQVRPGPRWLDVDKLLEELQKISVEQ